MKNWWIRFLMSGTGYMIWTQPKQIGPVQNNWYSTKMIFDGPKWFWTHRRTRQTSAHKNMLAHVCLFISPDLFTRLFHLACTSMDDHSLKKTRSFYKSIHPFKSATRWNIPSILILLAPFIFRLDTTQKCRVKKWYLEVNSSHLKINNLVP